MNYYIAENLVLWGNIPWGILYLRGISDTMNNHLESNVVQ